MAASKAASKAGAPSPANGSAGGKASGRSVFTATLSFCRRGGLGGGRRLVQVRHHVYAAFEAGRPIDEFLDHRFAAEQRAVLRGDDFDVQVAHHIGPEAHGAISGHVAAVETFHVLQVRVEVGDFEVIHAECGAEVASVEDLGDRVVDLHVAHAVQEVRGQGVQRRAAHFERHALVGDAQQPVLKQVVQAEMRHEAQPQRGDVRGGVGGHQPAIDRGDDVRVLVREEQVAQPGRGQGPRRSSTELANRPCARRDRAAWPRRYA